MDIIYTKGNPFNILFVWRLVPEKWTKILLECIKKTMIHKSYSEMIHWHIVWDGKDFSLFQSMKDRFPEGITLHGKQDGYFLSELRGMMNLAFVPSIFLETFWLVALESLTANLPVCGFKKWWLVPFIPDYLTLDESNPSENFLKILDSIFENGFKDSPDLSLFDKNLWREELKLVVGEHQNILIVHDYLAPIGGAEKYIVVLKNELTALGKNVKFFWHHWPAPRWKRILLSMLSPFAFWHERTIREVIQVTNPSLIWMHGVSRFIGPWWLKTIVESGKTTILTHHDLGLITARPSETTSESQIPHGLKNIQEFIWKTFSPIEYTARSLKYFILKIYWKYLKNVSLHLVPSEFMKSHIQEFWGKQVETFPHSIID